MSLPLGQPVTCYFRNYFEGVIVGKSSEGAYLVATASNIFNINRITLILDIKEMYSTPGQDDYILHPHILLFSQQFFIFTINKKNIASRYAVLV